MKIEELPLSYSQQRLWFLAQFQPDSAFYNIPLGLRLVGNLDITALERSLKAIIDRHEVLRTNFITREGQPIQIIHPEINWTLSLVDLKHLSAIEKEITAQKLMQQQGVKPFDLVNDFLLRATLVVLSDTEYILILCMHHIVSDAWSMGVFVQELGTIYKAYTQGQPSPLEPLPVQYGDFTLWQRDWLQESGQEKQLAYWKKQLADAATFLPLPTNRPRPAIQTFRGNHQEFTISEELTTKLIKLSQEKDVTLFMTLLTALDVLLYRYTGQEDILVGTPIANRNYSEIEGLIGFFVNTLVMRSNLSGNPSFSELLTRTQRTAMEAYAHQDLPFEMLLEALQPERNLSHSPLFQVMFALQNTPISNLELSGLSVSPIWIETETAKFDLTLAMRNTATGLVGIWEYNSDLFDASTIERISKHFITLLTAIGASPQERIGQLPLLTEFEEKQLLIGAYNTQVDYPQDKCIHQLFEKQVEQRPDAVALVFGDEKLTYDQLNTKANQLAHYLLENYNIQPNTLIGICVERSLEMIVGILGILKAGGAYVPLDPTYPQERLNFMLEDAQLPIVLTQQHLIESLQKHQASVICLDSDWEKIQQQRESNPKNVVISSNLAYIIYTSGSTGQPKGVLVNHSNVGRLFAATNHWYNFGPQDVWTLFHSYAFDFSVWEIWGALLYGGRLVVVPYLVTRSPESFYKLLCQEQVTILNQTPSAFRQLIQIEQSQANIDELKLRFVIFGGEALEIHSLRPWFERHGDQTPQLVNMYGITETTVHVTYRPITLSDLKGTASVIGSPIPDLQIYVLDKHLQLVPVGVSGEMYVGGAGVTYGYLNRPQLTAERFINNPFNPSIGGSKLYKTGDLARYLPNGELEYLGRIDNQVKIRGFRIELGEIEALLLQHPVVSESVVIVREDKLGEKRLVAYVIPKSEQSLRIAELRRFLKQKLPEYMIPSAFVQLEGLPLTANGKLDRRALPTPDSVRPELETLFVAPSTTEERILAEIWTSVLDVEQVGINDNFFALGGDSIRSIQVLSKAREQGFNFSVQQLFQHQTIQELVEALKVNDNNLTELEVTQPFSLISEADKQQLPDGVEDAYPVAMLQMGMFFHSEYEQDRAIYREISSFHLKTSLDIQKLRVALQDLVNCHPVLRTSFELSQYSVPLQLVHHQGTVEVPLSVENWSHLTHSEQEEALDAWFEEEKARHFDWTHPPLLRFFVHRRSWDTFNLTLSCHHVILDGWSVSSMMTELFERYLSLLSDKGDFVAPSLSLTYRDFVALEQQVLASPKTQRYWTEKLHDLTVTELPRWTSVSRKAKTQKSQVQDIILTPEIGEGLKKLAQSAEVPLKSVLLAAHLRVVSFLSGQSDVLTGLVANGRPEQSDGDRILGLFLNTLPFRLQLTGGTWIDLVRQVFAAETELLPHRRYPMAQIQRNLGGESLFETAFNFINFHVFQKVQEFDNLQVLGGKFFEETNFTFTAQFGINPISSRLALQFEYDPIRLDSQQINSIGEYYLNTLAAMVNQPEEHYEFCSLLSPQEQQQLLIDWNDTQVDYPFYQCVHHLFEEQVKRTPDAVAGCFEEQSLTYQQLNQQANQLAHYLQDLGVGSETFVGLYLERSLSIIVALLAVLKAGGAYVPLDPDYPPKRLAYIAQDSQFKLLITQTSLQNTLPLEGVTVLCVDQIAETLKTGKIDNLVSQVEPKNLACLLYTSGSTGNPKGVMLAHEALVSHSFAISEVFGLSSSDRVLQFASFSFDVAAEEIFPTWLTGGTVVLRPVQMFATLTDFADFIESESISVINITPAYWHEWAIAVSQGIATVHKSLRVAAVGGDAVIPETVTIWKKWVGKRVNCINVYGPTEASVTAIVHDLLSDEAEAINSVLIGRPIANTKAYILDSNLQPVPLCVRGELHLCGPRLARGYLHRPELTAQKFIDNPFEASTKSPFKRLYKTGDVACYLPDGSIECFGRIDNQVKIRGFRIELGEIEAILNQNTEIQTSCVIIREDKPGDKYLVAYIVPQSERVPLISDLRQYLSNQLPLYMVPQAFVFLETLPLTPNRKVDRRALPAPDLYSDRRDSYLAPRNPIELMLTQIWTEILKVEQIGVHDNFFELGGHSLLATQLVSRIRRLLKIEIPLKSVFSAATVAELAHLITQAQKQAIIPTIAEILPRTPETHPPTPSFAQTRLWFLDQLQPNSALYNIPVALRFEGHLNQEALKASLREICQRHEALRANFFNVNGQPTIVIHPELPEVLSILDWREDSLPTDEQEERVKGFISTQSQRPFNLSSDPLFRATLLILSDTEQILWVCMHHIVSDGWSIEVFIHELTTLYRGGVGSNLAPLPIQYTDFAIWQKRWLQGDVLQNQLSYWKKQLADAPYLSLPTDRPRPAMQTFVGAHQKFTLSPEITQGLKDLSTANGVTLFMTLLAAFDVLLSRYSGETDILVGTPIANRNRSELEGLIGFFANTLVLRTSLAGNPSFKELLGQVRSMTMDAYAHQDLPFEMLVDALQPERNLSHNPIFQVAFIFHNTSDYKVELPDLVITEVGFENNTAKFDLTLALQNGEEGLIGVFEYNTDLFESSTIEGMAGHFVTLIEGIVANPEERVNQLPLLTTIEQKQLLVDWNQTQVDYQSLCIHQLFEEQALRHPDAVAVVYQEQTLTYGELNCRANQLGSYLRSQGVIKGQIVGLCVKRSLEMMIAILGILKAGGAYLPLDPDYPPERLRYMIEDAQLSIVVTQEAVRERLPEGQYQQLCYEKIDIDKQPSVNIDERITPNDLASLIYTSGSTGQPKGVMVEHRGLYNLSQAQLKTFKLSNNDRILQFSSLSFDACIWEILMAVGAGATLYLDSKENLAPGAPLMQRLKDYRITQVTLPPSALAVLPEGDLPDLKTIVVAGEACPPDLVKKWSELYSFYNAYGPTEGSVCATVAPLSHQEKVTIGRPIDNVQVYILDGDLQPVPVGVAGELFMGGAGLARGYLNRPELTAQKFIPNPFMGGKLYKTGDLARYLPGGEIEYLGRIDNQVKIRGFRIELGEIEAVLSSLPEVREAVVEVRDDREIKRLVAYIVPRLEIPKTSTITPTLSEQEWENLVQSLRSSLKKCLPDYMIPSNFVVLESLPLTPNGKIDRRALPAPELQRGENWTAPRNEIEIKLASIWQEVLKLDSIGVNDNFFELGGHSLLATQIISLAQENFNISLPLRFIFDFPTIAQLSEAIAQELETNPLNLPPILPVSRDADIPLSWAQERLWFVNQLEGNSGAYTVDLTLRLLGDLNLDALEQAFGLLVERHEPLRTQFKLKDSQPIQAIASSSHFTLPVVNVEHFSPQEIKGLLAEAVSEPFDLANGSVLRVKLWQIAPDEYVLLLAIHHIAADGWSLGVLINDLSAYYRGFCGGERADLPPLPIQYADFAVWQRQWFTDEVLERQLNYWKQQLADVPLLHQLPGDRPRPPIQTFRGGTEPFQLDQELTLALKKLAQKSGSTLFMTLLAGFAVLISRYSGQTDLVIGSPIANRTRKEIEGLIGFFVNTLVLRFDLSQEPTFEEFLAQVRTLTQNAYENQDLPFEMLVEELQIERHLDRNPLAQIVFALQNAPDADWDLPGVKVEDMASELDSVRVDLEVYLWDLPAGLRGFCSYNRDIFDSETIKRLMSHFQVLLKAIVENPQQPVSKMPLLTSDERQKLLIEWNQTLKVEASFGCIHQLFEDVVERTPNAICVAASKTSAVVFEDQQLTYLQLNQKANQLAYYLISLGVSADTLVGICVGRGPLMIIGILAILKAGGAYVPLDPEYPQERLSFMLEDAQVSLILTQRSLEAQLSQHRLLLFEDIAETIAQNPQENPQIEIKPSHLANVIYTSGSTGRPKGVMVEHKGLYNLALAQIEAFGLHPDSRVLQFASFSFDACISEILMALGSGASLYLGSKDDIMPGQPLISQLERNRITHITLPPSALAVLPTRSLPDLKTLIVAGEACSPELVKQWSVGRNFYNGYGPTEGSVCATIAQCHPDDDQVTIGRPITNVQVYILDSLMQPVPIGVYGEVHIGGAGVARGYLNRPELTAEKFIPNPFMGGKLYKTGDLARYLADGNIEYIGRIDHQVKLRGFRIETGEIEAVLSQHPLIRESVCIVREDHPGDQRLVAYLVPGADSRNAVREGDYVSDWQTLYEQAYSQQLTVVSKQSTVNSKQLTVISKQSTVNSKQLTVISKQSTVNYNDCDDPTFNISGWNSSYTRQPIPAPEMRIWVDSTVKRILSLSPQNVLEIGCGMGLFVYRVAKHCQEYWATDYSQSAIEYVQQVCQTVAGLDNVQVRQGTADNFEDIPQGKFDTVILNSVIQYFPSVEYLLKVIEGAIATLTESGSIFLGDVRSLPLLEPYHALAQFYQSQDMTVKQWQRNITDSIADEEELVIDPQFFLALKAQFPQITWVEIEPKRGYAQNELVQFRYDVTLHIGKSVEVQTIDWLSDLSLTDLERQLKQEKPQYLGIRRVPNQRVQQGLQLWKWCENLPKVETVKELSQLLSASEGINPETLWELGEKLGYHVNLSWWESSQDGCFDVVFSRQSFTDQIKVIAFEDRIKSKSWTDYTNNPLQGKLVQKLVPQVRDFLEEKLPSYMIPQGFILLNALPLTPNGKIDRRALPALDITARNLEVGFVAPHSPIEVQLAQVWGEVLGINRIGTQDNFFELGGHSLLATQVIYRLRDIFSVEISLQNFLEYPTIAGLSQIIEVLTVGKDPQTLITENQEDYEEGEL